MQSKQAVKKRPNWKDFRNCEQRWATCSVLTGITPK